MRLHVQTNKTTVGHAQHLLLGRKQAAHRDGHSDCVPSAVVLTAVQEACLWPS